VLTIALMGAGDELLQSMFPYRGASIGDWLVDCSAATITSALLWAVLPNKASNR
jgi:VanZ family protein